MPAEFASPLGARQGQLSPGGKTAHFTSLGNSRSRDALVAVRSPRAHRSSGSGALFQTPQVSADPAALFSVAFRDERQRATCHIERFLLPPNGL